MQKIFEIDDLPTTYQKQGKSYPFPDLTHTLCPHCHKQYLHRHGFYRRYLITKRFEGFIRIRRYICRVCGRTVSILPWFCHPKRTYSMEFIHCVLANFFRWSGTITSFIQKFTLEYGIPFTRQLLYQYRKRILKNCNRILMELIRQFHPNEPISDSPNTKKGVKDALEFIETAARTPFSVSMDMFSHGFRTYLTL